MKCNADERPNISEFSLLMFELTFLKYIDKKMVAEEMWNKKGNLYYIFIFHFERI